MREGVPDQRCEPGTVRGDLAAHGGTARGERGGGGASAVIAAPPALLPRDAARARTGRGWQTGGRGAGGRSGVWVGPAGGVVPLPNAEGDGHEEGLYGHHGGEVGAGTGGNEHQQEEVPQQEARC